MLRVDDRNPRARALAERVQRALPEGVELAALPGDPCVVVGGDGHMLATMRELGTSPTYLGLNAGHLGFLLNDCGSSEAVFAERVAQLAAGAFQTWHFPRLAMHAATPDGRTIQTTAVNDLYLERATGQTARLHVVVDGEEVVRKLVCDGLLVATALGSTAYSFSAGGVPCHPLVRAVHITPISPHAPRLSPLIVPLGTTIALEALDVERRPVRAIADGVDMGSVVNMRVEQAESDVKLAFLEGHQFTRTLVHKVLRG
jgi:NAD+ kinase